MSIQTVFILLLLGNIVAIFFAIKYISRSMKTETGDIKIKEPPPGKVELVHDNVMIQKDLKEFSDEVIDKIDRRMGELRRLIKEADDRISSLETMSARAVQQTQRPAAAPAPAPASSDPEEDAQSSRSLAGGSGRRASIIRLSRKGRSSEEIAQEIGMGRGEVELILNVENSRRRT